MAIYHKYTAITVTVTIIPVGNSKFKKLINKWWDN